MAVVFPVPAGARASWTRRPEVASSRTSARWAVLRPMPLAAVSAIAIPTRTSLIAPPAAASGGRERGAARRRRSPREVYSRAPCRLYTLAAIRSGQTAGTGAGTR